MGTITLDALTPELAATLCRFCMQQEQLEEPHYKLEWFKWPNSEVTRLFEQVIGQQLPVSSHLSEHFCSSCHWWLKETHEAIKRFKIIDSCWKQYLAEANMKADEEETITQLKSDAAVEFGVDDSPVADEGGFKVEYLEEEYQGTTPTSGDEPAVVVYKSCDTTTSSILRPVQHDEETADDNYQIECIGYTEDEIDDDNPLGLTASSFECDACAEVVATKRLLGKHFALHHGWHRKYSCETCPKVFRQESAFIRHSHVHPPAVTSLQCCGRTYASKLCLVRHQRSVHGPDQPSTCTVCQKVFRSKTKLYNHMQRHGEKKHGCTQCGRKFHMAKDLKLHLQVVHEQKRRFVCDLCGHRVTLKTSLVAHRARCGQADKTTQGRNARLKQSSRAFDNIVRPDLWCVECDFRCLRPATLKRHYVNVHPSADWEALAHCLCVKCLRQFETTELATEHRAKHHPTVQCDICKAVLMSELSLERHKKIHTVKDRPYTCAVCQGTYVTQHQLKMHHRRKHTDERPFACPVCDRRYAERSEMNVHIRSTHNNGERHQCAQCTNTYNSAKYLAMHVAREHTGDYNFFECTVCDSRFVNARVLGEHQAVHHPILSD